MLPGYLGWLLGCCYVVARLPKVVARVLRVVARLVWLLARWMDGWMDR